MERFMRKKSTKTLRALLAVMLVVMLFIAVTPMNASADSAVVLDQHRTFQVCYPWGWTTTNTDNLYTNLTYTNGYSFSRVETYVVPLPGNIMFDQRVIIDQYIYNVY
jgi:hypothetical protein